MTKLSGKMLGILFVALWSLSASAHTDLMHTNPKHGAVLAAQPETIVMNFAKEIRLAKVRLQGPDGTESKLSLKGQKKFLTQFEFPFLSDKKGDFTVIWRGIGSDGHVLNGEFTFTIAVE